MATDQNLIVRISQEITNWAVERDHLRDEYAAAVQADDDARRWDVADEYHAAQAELRRLQKLLGRARAGAFIHPNEF